MAVYHCVGDALVKESELFRKHEQRTRHDSGALESASSTMTFSTGTVNDSNALKALPDLESAGAVKPFVPIGLNKPLIVEIRNVYTGKHPRRKKDMLVTSAMKSIATFNAMPRAINFAKKGVEARSNITTVAATEMGTPLVSYSPALVEDSTVLTLEIAFDEFPDELFDHVSGALTSAAAIPLFATASPYLVAAGFVTKLIGKLVGKIVDRPAVFQVTDSLRFDTAGMAPPQADYRLLLEDEADHEFLKQHSVNQSGILVHKETNAPYEGDLPYVVVSLDGRKKRTLNDFAPTAASAAMLEKFFKIREGSEQPLQPLLEGLKLYNDLKFRHRADQVLRDIEQLDVNDSDYEEHRDALQKKHAALLDNIMSDLLKPRASA